MNEEIRKLQERKKRLKEAIEFTKQKKKEVVRIVQKLASKLSSKTITRHQYEEELKKALKNRTAEQWIKYYGDYIDYYNYQIKLSEKLIKQEKFGKIKEKVREKAVPALKISIVLVAIVLIFSLVFILRPVRMNVFSRIGEKVSTTINQLTEKPTEVEIKKEAEKFEEPKVEVSLEDKTIQISEESLIQYQAVVGRPVKWKKQFTVEEVTGFTIKLPKGSENISVKIIGDRKTEDVTDIVSINKRRNFLIFGERSIEVELNKKGITGNAISDNENSEEVLYEIIYETPAPEINELEAGEAVKRIKITGPDVVHYKNILSFTELPKEMSKGEIGKLKLYQIKDGNREAVKFTAYDTDENGLLDYIEWLIPELSEAEFLLIIEISKAEHLDFNKQFISDIYEQVKALDNVWSETINENEYVRVTFQQKLDNTKDITLYPKIVSGNPKIEVYEVDGEEKIAEFSEIVEGKNTVYLINLPEGHSQDVFDLKILGGGVEIDYIVDPANCWDGSLSLAIHPICTCNDLQMIDTDATTLSWDYELQNDIDCSDTINWNWNVNKYLGFKPIGVFTGNFNGKGFDIYNLYINRLTQGKVGLFTDNQAGSEIKNVGLLNVNIIGNSYVGALIGEPSGSVFNSFSTGSVSGGDYVGGLIGWNYDGQVSNSYSRASVSGSDNVGGLIGRVNSNVFNCYSTGSVAGASNVGGLVGYNPSPSGTCTNSFWDTETSGQTASNCGTSKTTAEMKDVATFTDIATVGLVTPWDFVGIPNDDTGTEDIWNINPAINDGYPFLRFLGLEEVYNCQVLDQPNTLYIQTADIENNNLENFGSCINITAQNVTFDCQGHYIISDDDVAGVYSNQKNTTIKNCNVSMGTGGGIGIELGALLFAYANNSYIYNNTLNNQNYGLYLAGGISDSMENIKIEKITASNNSNTGIYLSYSSNNIITDITANNNTDAGIYLSYSSNNTLTDITANDNNGAGIYLYSSSNNTLTDITANNNSNVGIRLSSSSNNTLTNISANNNGDGIYFYLQSDNPILTNITTNNNRGYGIYFQQLDNAVLTNIIANNNSHGIYGFDSNNFVLRNITTNMNGNYGVNFDSSNNLNLTNANANYNVVAIYFYIVYDFVLTDITIQNCTTTTFGCLYFDHANNNVISRVFINNSNGKLILIQEGDNNIFRDTQLIGAINNNVFLEENSINNTFLNISYNISKEYVESGSELIRKWYYQANISYQGKAVNNANLSAYNRTGIPYGWQFNLTSKANGYTNITEIIDYVNLGWIRNYYSNYTIETINGSLSEQHQLNVTLASNNSGMGVFGGLIFENIVLRRADIIPPNINFTFPTPPDGNITSNNFIPVNVSASDVGRGDNNISVFIDFDNSILGWWRMDDLNVSGGLTDYFGKINMSKKNSPSQVDGKLGKAFYFDGDNNLLYADYFDAGYNNLFNFTEATISLWINPDTFGTADSPIFFGDIAGVTDIAPFIGWGMVAPSGNLRFQISNGVSINETGSVAVSTGVWTHIVGRINETGIALYKNGVLGSSAAKEHNVTATTDFEFVIGTKGMSDSFNGTIDDVLVFNRSLSDKEIAALYANQSSRYLFKNFTNLQSGNYTFKAYAQDTAGNVNATETRQVTINANTLTGCNNLTTENTTYILLNNVTSTGTCFNIQANNITLDCNDYEINYSSDGGDYEYGIYSAYNFTTIKNCIIKEGLVSGTFDYAIYLNRTSNGTIDNNTITTSGNYGYGIHLSSSSTNTLSNNTITTSGNDGDGIFLFSSSNFNTLSNNIITTSRNDGDGIHLYSSSTNTLSNNIITTSRDAGYGIYLTLSSNNNVTDTNILGGNTNDVFLTSSSINNVFLNVSYNTSSESVCNDCELIRKWYYQANITSNNLPVNNANLSAYNNSYPLGWQFNLTSNSSGWTNRTEIIDYISNGTRNYYSNYTIDTTSGTLSESHQLNVTFASNNSGTGTFGGLIFENINLGLGNMPPEIVFISDINYKDTGVLLAERDLILDSAAKKDFEFYVWSEAGVSALPTGAAVTSSTALLTLKDTVNPPNRVRKSSDVTPAVVCSHNRDATCLGSHTSDTCRIYRCSVGMYYYDDWAITPGNWRVYAYIKDNFNQEDGYTAAEILIQNNIVLPTRMTFFNKLDSSKLVPDTGNMNFGTVGFGPQTTQPTDAGGTYPLRIRNTGNSDITPIRLQSSNIPGDPDNTKLILASWFDMSEASSNPCVGTALVAGSLVNTGMAQINNGLGTYGDLRVCLTDVQATATVQAYSTTATGGVAWVVDTTFVNILSLIKFIRFNFGVSVLFAVAVVVKRKKKKTRKQLIDEEVLKIFEEKLDRNWGGIEELLNIVKKEKVEEKIRKPGEEIEIPISIFRENIGCAEVLCKYLKENLGLKFSEIAKLLNRDDRTIWINYRNAIKRKKSRIKAEKKLLVPINIFSDRRLSILESVVKYLKEKGLKNVEIAELLGKDQRNVYTLYSRAKKKMR